MKTSTTLAVLAVAQLVGGAVIAPADAQSNAGGTGRAAPQAQSQGQGAAPPANAPGRLPLATQDQFEGLETSPPATPSGAPGVSKGSRGPKAAADADGDAPQAFGTSTFPYTTSRVAVQALGNSSTANRTPVTSYPFRASGKLWMRFGTSWYVCSASLIGRGILVTAAHCVHNYGKRAAGWANAIEFVPANFAAGVAGQPYGKFTYRYAAIPTPYFAGTDTCTQVGVVCNNDIAIVVLNPRNGVLPGNMVGWYSYGWNGYSFVTSAPFGSRFMSQIHQLGYPVSHDAGQQMQRTDAPGVYYASGNLRNTQIGSAQTGGSSGGPWLVNLGAAPVVSGASRGQALVQAVVGVTSYGSTTVGYNRQGSSWFGQNVQYPAANYGGRGAGNIGFLVNFVCSQPAFTASC